MTLHAEIIIAQHTSQQLDQTIKRLVANHIMSYMMRTSALVL